MGEPQGIHRGLELVLVTIHLSQIVEDLPQVRLCRVRHDIQPHVAMRPQTAAPPAQFQYCHRARVSATTAPFDFEAMLVQRHQMAQPHGVAVSGELVPPVAPRRTRQVFRTGTYVSIPLRMWGTFHASIMVLHRPSAERFDAGSASSMFLPASLSVRSKCFADQTVQSEIAFGLPPGGDLPCGEHKLPIGNQSRHALH